MQGNRCLPGQPELPLTQGFDYGFAKLETEKETALQTQVGGSHYKDWAIQPIEFSMRNKLNACQHSIIKYVLRYNLKGTPRDDLEKARHFIELLIELENL